MNINDDEILKLKDSIENKKYFNDENNENNISLDDRDNKSDIVNLSVEEKIIKSMITLTESSKIKEKENESEEISKLKNEIRIKDNIINKMKEEISVLSQTQIIEHRTIVEDEEFNELVDENEELKKMNKELIEKLNECNNNSTRTKTDIINKEDNLNENDNGGNNEKQSQIINQQKQELELLRTRFEQLYRELNQYRQKNSDLNIEIKKLKDQSFNDSKSIYSMNDELTINKMKKSYNDEIEKLAFKLSSIEDENSKLKELLKQSGNELNNKSVKIDIINEEDEDFIKNEKDED
jgi:chromosome segregation ATPase